MHRQILAKDHRYGVGVCGKEKRGINKVFIVAFFTKFLIMMHSKDRPVQCQESTDTNPKRINYLARYSAEGS